VLGKLLEGAAWFATLSLATAGGLTFVPDGAWETFPTALRPARAKLAEFGVAPTRYRAAVDAENGGAVAANNGATAQSATGNDGVGVGGAAPEDVWQASANVRIGERWKRGRGVGETLSPERWASGDATGLALENRAQGWRLEPETGKKLAAAGVAETEQTRVGVGVGDERSFADAATQGSEPIVEEKAAPSASPDGTWENDAIPPFSAEIGGAETGGAADESETPFPVVGNFDAPVGVDAPSETLAGTGEIAPLASSGDAVAAVDGNVFNGDVDFNAPANLLEQADAALTSDLNAVPPAAPVDEAAELRDALAAVATASTPEEIKTVFVALNKIRDERGRRLAVEDAQALDAALDRLAFDVFYNPAQAILEPRWQTAPGESLASIAERLGTTPETLAEINGIKTPVDAPLPVGASLKTVRGPASAEISIAKKELTLRFNGLYAGRFALGVPESSATLRGDFRVVEKLANPNCDAVDANGQTIAIPGGAPENPLGSAWIALDGGVGLQGTNRPELVGQTISENGGFVFSNREISQLSVLLPVGAVVKIVD
jgi:hypothetical protein